MKTLTIQLSDDEFSRLEAMAAWRFAGRMHNNRTPYGPADFALLAIRGDMQAWESIREGKTVIPFRKCDGCPHRAAPWQTLTPAS